ncbi:nucleoid-associated protein [Odoribacter sp. Z80]|uniref:nucleoid-associated protein n=1 Tax=Odoribacter sp. Z80 TaxID=2304575 RepID=UPI00137999D8|nr:nucleoid-associated protein [Odoribacter sp. Z80]NCE71500.1 nucleoid-associated protein [Odoribacter sp. Z80]
MINFENCEIANIVIHHIGNKFEGDSLSLSDNCFLPEDTDVLHLLKSYFLSAFKKDAYYHFLPYEGELLNNPVYASATAVFSDQQAFYEQSVEMAQHLYEQSNNPNIKPGELYIVHFRNCNIEEGICDAIGIFKSETKDTFLKIVLNQNTYQLIGESGINIKKLDKACIIFNITPENGYKVCILDKTNTKEAVYWTTDFLGLEPGEDSYFQTANYLDLCKNFVKDIYNQENDVPRADQIDMLNRSINFFKDAEVFSEDRFKEEVVREPEVIHAFENFKSQYETDNNMNLSNEFAVSDYAVKDEKKYFRHVLKLDKNFHVYIHGEKKYIRKGYDAERDMNYYTLYFRNEE